ncbi:MAG: UMP kinase [candidate division WOR-3 bacterium]|nr:UMP kinase [candidate division WOR-3 bacterium]
MENNLSYNKILLKISGDFFRKEDEFLSFEGVRFIASQVKAIHKMGVKIGIVVGGGNILRGSKSSQKYGLPADELDELGMQATLLNSGLLSSTLKNLRVPNVVLSAIPVSPSIGEPYNRFKTEEFLSRGNVLIFGGGTGNPYFTTDTASVLRALQIHADILLKATNVDGVYDKDPNKFKDAKLYKRLTYREALKKDLRIMDLTAFSLARDHKLSIIVFNAKNPRNIEKAVLGKDIGTIIEGGSNE